MEEPIEPKRIVLVLTVFAENLLLTEILYGWTPLLLKLQAERQYAELCGEDSSVIDNKDSGFVCVEQENKLDLMFAVACVVMNIASLPVGTLVDYAGPTNVVTIAAVVQISGLFLMEYADSQMFDVFLPACSLLAIGGKMTLMASFPASFVIVKYQIAILAGINCLFDGSSVVFLILYSMQSAFETNRQQLFIRLALLAGVIYFLLIVFWSINECSQRSETSDSVIDDKDVLKNTERQAETPNVVFSAAVDDIDASLKLLHLEPDALQLVDVAIRKQLESTQFVFITVFSTVQTLRATIYIGTTNKQLENYGDANYDYIYTKIFSGILPIGFVFLPLINHILEKHGLVPSLLVTIGLGVRYNLLSLVPNLPVRCLTFVLFTGFRSFLYTIQSVFVAKVFGLKNLVHAHGHQLLHRSTCEAIGVPGRVRYERVLGWRFGRSQLRHVARLRRPYPIHAISTQKRSQQGGTLLIAVAVVWYIKELKLREND